MSMVDDFKNQEEEAFDDIDDQGFEEFDTTNKGSLGDLWTNNPMLKLGVVGVGLIVVIAGLIIFGGKKEETKSVIGQGSQGKELPGGELSPDMTKRIEESNEQGYRQAQGTGTSFVPISTNTATGSGTLTGEAQPDPIDDPLTEWRNRDRNQLIKEERQPGDPIDLEPIDAVQPEQVILQPDPEMIASLAGAMANQMERILAQHNVSGPRHLAVTPVSFLNSGDGSGADDDSGDADEDTEIPMEVLVPAGTVVYAQTLTEANTDAPGPVLAQILSGPLKGSRILGGFSETDRFLVISFDQVVYKGESISVDAVALDVDTTLTGVATDIDRRYFKRVVLPAAAAFIEGFGSAVAETGGTTVSVEGETVTTQTEDLDTREELFKGVEEATKQIGEFMEEEAERTQVMIKVAAGTPVGILFVAPVERPIVE